MTSSRSTSTSGLNDVLSGVQTIVDALHAAIDDEQSVGRTVQFGASGETVEGVVGIRVTTGIGRATVSVRETIDPASSDEERPEEVRRPAVDVFDEGEQVRIIAEMPGVSADDLVLTVEDDKLLLQAETEHRTYWRAVSLPRAVDAEHKTVTAEAGLVDIVLLAAEENGDE